LLARSSPCWRGRGCGWGGGRVRLAAIIATRSRGLDPAKKINCWVRPGVLDARASAFLPVSALIRLDLPTLDRPANATSNSPARGKDSTLPVAEIKLHSPAKSRRPASISALEKSAAVLTVVVAVFMADECHTP